MKISKKQQAVLKSYARGVLVSFLTFLESTAFGVTKTTNMEEFNNAVAISSDHSTPGSIPPSNQIRSPELCKFLISEKTLKASL